MIMVKFKVYGLRVKYVTNYNLDFHKNTNTF